MGGIEPKKEKMKAKKRSKNRRAGFEPKKEPPRHKRGPALMARPVTRKPPMPIRPIHPETGQMIGKAGDGKIRFFKGGPVYLRLGNSKKGKHGTIIKTL